MSTIRPTASRPTRHTARAARAARATLPLLAAPLAALLASRPAAAQDSARAPRVLDTVRVTTGTRGASPAALTRSVSIVSREEIAASAARTVGDVLAMQLGVDVRARSAAQADVAMRGSASGQVLVLVNGVRVGDLQSSHFDLDLAVPLAAVERVEVLRGAATTLYGPDAVAGVVNIITAAAGPRASLDARAGSFGTRGVRASTAPRVGAATVHAAAEDERSTGHRAGTDYRARQASLGVGAPLAGGTLRADAGYGDRGFGAAGFYGPYPSYERTRTATGSLRWSGAVARTWGVQATLGARRHEDDFILYRAEPARYRNQHDNRQGTGEVVVRWTPAAPAALAMGASALDARLTSARLGERRERRGALFTEARLGAPAGRLVVLGARAERSSTDGGSFSPSVSAALPMGARSRLRLSVERAERAPSWTERYYVDPANVGNPDLVPERFVAGEVGLTLLPPWAIVDVAWWGRRAEGLIDWARPRGSASTEPWRTLNVESATFQGAELQVTLPRWLGATWRLRGAALAFHSDATAEWEGKYALRPITREAGARATWTAGRTTATVDASVARREGYDEAQLLSTLRVAHRWRELTLTADVTNLADARWHDVVGQPVAGRGVFLGLGWSLPAAAR